MYCKNCGNEIDPNAAICVKCGFQKGKGENYCHNCGQEVAPGAAVCMKCGFAQTAHADVEIADGKQKSKLVAGLLGIFLGGIGVHHFYLGNTKMAVIHLALAIGGICLMCVPTIGSGIWGLVEGILILCGRVQKDGKGMPLKD